MVLVLLLLFLLLESAAELEELEPALDEFEPEPDWPKGKVLAWLPF